ncbi:MAG: AbrB/MazE/SpoVT family DNA-binding domain-containing protein [Acidobacteriota bacterium]|nr:MAG: AbrB/MazE/SpoVT family DNA-binding domain-containing protein [Acidobacteriota bacterium]
MKAQIIQIGNSQGLRLPKMMLEESGISGEVDLELRDEGILIKRSGKPREGWDAAFRSIAENDDELTADGSNDFDRRQWQW